MVQTEIDYSVGIILNSTHLNIIIIAILSNKNKTSSCMQFPSLCWILNSESRFHFGRQNNYIGCNGLRAVHAHDIKKK